MAAPVDEEGRGSGRPALLGRLKVALDPGLVDTGVQLRRHPLGVEAELRPDLKHRLPRELGLSREEGVVVLPELPLDRRRLACLRRQRRERMSLGDRQVSKGEDKAAVEPLVDPAEDRLGTQAERALKVAEHDQLQRPAQLAADVVDFFERRIQRVHAAGC